MIEYLKKLLSPDQIMQYDLLLYGIRQELQNVDLPISQNIVNDIQRIYQYVLADHPELYYASPQIAAVMSNRFFTVKMSYLYEANLKREIEKSFSRLYGELKKELCKLDIDKIIFAIYMLMKDSKYEINNLYNQNAATAIHFHAAQCSGFASAFKCAMDFFGIWCIVVSGNVSNGTQSGPHAWNIVKINESYCHVDVTSLMSVKLTTYNQLTHYRLFESDSQKKQQGYTWNISDAPECINVEIGALKEDISTHDDTRVLNNNNQACDINLPTFTRLFDVQRHIADCLKNV